MKCPIHQHSLPIKKPSLVLGFFIGKESDDDLLWFRHHINETDVSLHRKKLAVRASCHFVQVGQSKTHKQKTRHEAGLFAGKESDDDLLSHTYAHYHRRKVVSLSCSGWEGVGPTRYDRQT